MNFKVAQGIEKTAKALGINPVDLATAISYETGGTFDPVKEGPTTKWGKHRGLIQFGEPQSKQYGVDYNNPIETQLGENGAIAKYLRDAGVKEGMGLLDVYSAINAGRVGKYNASDAQAGGMPGTVADKVNSQMGDHRKKAQLYLASNTLSDEELFEKLGLNQQAPTQQPQQAQGQARPKVEMTDEELFERLGLNQDKQTPEQPLQQAPTQQPQEKGLWESIYSQGKGLVQGIANSASLGFLDEVASGIEAGIISPFTDKTFSEEYDDRLKIFREYEERTRKEAPVSELVGNIAGLVATGGAGAATKAGGKALQYLASGSKKAQALKSALASGAVGGIEGFGGGEGGAGQRLQSAAIGGAVGGVTGAIAPSIGRGIERLLKPDDVTGQVRKIMTPEEIAQTTQKATSGFGQKKASDTLAWQAMPDAKIIESAKRLGIQDHLQLDHITTNDSFRTLSQVIKSANPNSVLARQEKEGLEQISKRADDLISEIGGTRDLSNLNVDVKRSLQDVQQQLLEKSDPIYKKINSAIPSNTEAPADNIVDFLDQKVQKGLKLTSEEKELLRDLSPKKDVIEETTLLDRALGKPQKTRMRNKYTTYARLEQLRKELTMARVKNKGVFKDYDSALISKLEDLTMKDQKAVVEKFGLLDDFNIAQKTVAMRKSVENDLTSLLGKQLDGSIVKKLASGVKDLPKGDTANFAKMMRSIPDDMKKEVTSSALGVAFNARLGKGGISHANYVDFYDGLMRNKQARDLLFQNLDKVDRKKMQDLYRVSKGIKKSQKEFITTGRIETVKNELLNNVDSLANKVYNLADKSAPLEIVSSTVGLPGAGLVGGLLRSIGKKNKPDVFKLADELLTSPEFIALAQRGTPEAVEKMSKMPKFKIFLNSVGEKIDPKDFLVGAIQANRVIGQEITEKEE